MEDPAQHWVPPQAAAGLVQAISGKPDFARLLAAMAAKMSALLPPDDIVALALRARALARNDPYVWRVTESIVRRSIPSYLWFTPRDERRNSAYDQAIRANVTPKSVVLEIGTGSGILAMMAARAGAAHVYACEKVPALARAARAIIAQNNYADRITVIEADARDLKIGGLLPRRCDVLLHGFFAFDPGSHALRNFLIQARSFLLAPSAVVLPERVWARGQLIGDTWPIDRITLGEHAGFDLSVMNDMAPSGASRPGPAKLTSLLSDPFELVACDLTADAVEPSARSRRVQITEDGIATNVVQSVGFSFPGGIVVESDLGARDSWVHHFHPLRPAPAVKAGQQIGLCVECHDGLLTIALS